MPPHDTRFYNFGPFRLDWHKRLLLSEGRQEHLPPRVAAVLHDLLVNRARVVTRQELLDRCWPGTTVEEGNVDVTITRIRKLLGGKDQEYIETVYGLGYTFVGEVTESNDQPDPVKQSVKCVILTAVFAMISAAVFKAVPGAFGLALTQASASAGMGAFQGATAGVIWAGTIILGLTWYDVRRGIRRAPSDSSRGAEGREQGGRMSGFWDAFKSSLRPPFSLVVGALCGFVSSLVIILVVTSVFEVRSIEFIGWIRPGRERFSLKFLQDLFINTRFAWPYLITGASLGVGMAMTRNGLLASARWSEFLERQGRIVGGKHALAVSRDIMPIVARYALPLLVIQVLGGVLAFFVPEAGPGANVFRAGTMGLAAGLSCDCATQVFGAFFGIVGMGLGVVIDRWGLHLEGAG
ncbi:MAG: winged helix-turn-helix domain-containing protein [Acidobacteria bacterium]|nr:winged helix-turn-helix domain-containing protein [Acidobacteriota bacterium]